VVASGAGAANGDGVVCYWHRHSHLRDRRIYFSNTKHKQLHDFSGQDASHFRDNRCFDNSDRHLHTTAGALMVCGCCVPTACNCGTGPVRIPESVTVVISLGDFFSVSGFGGSNGTCTHEEAVDFIEGTYVLSTRGINAGFVIYRMTTESGAEISFTWSCSNGGLTFDSVAEVGFQFCDPAATCFARANIAAYLDSSVLLGLCNYEQLNTDDISYEPPNVLFLEQGPISLCSSASTNTGRRYYWSLTATPAW